MDINPHVISQICHRFVGPGWAHLSVNTQFDLALLEMGEQGIAPLDWMNKDNIPLEISSTCLDEARLCF